MRMYMSTKKTTEKKVSVISEKRSRPRKDKKEINSSAPESKAALEALEHNRKQIIEMQNRILSAPAMNGGFSNLMYKIEKIEQSQEKLVEKVDDIRDVLYDPDSGLYARIKNVENQTAEVERVENLEEEIKYIKSWKESKDKLAEKEEIEEADVEKILREHAEVLKELQKWYERQAGAIKWIALTLGTALFGIIGKIIHVYIMNQFKVP